MRLEREKRGIENKENIGKGHGTKTRGEKEDFHSYTRTEVRKKNENTRRKRIRSTKMRRRRTKKRKHSQYKREYQEEEVAKNKSRNNKTGKRVAETNNICFENERFVQQ